jgi:SpoVK/Ycf46/Vps4 family AAA+-type ATPase
MEVFMQKKLILSLIFSGLALSAAQIFPGDKPSDLTVVNTSLFALALCTPVLLQHYLNTRPTFPHPKEFQFKKPTEKLSSIAGKQPDQLQTMLNKLKKPEAYVKANPNATIENFVLYGPPGTGKTHRARAMAGELNIAFCPITSNELQGYWLGQTAPRVNALFSEARSCKPVIETPGRWQRFKTWLKPTPPTIEQPKIQKPYAMIFIDEIDGLGNRETLSANTRSHSPIDYILTELTKPENEGILVVGACNQTNLDPALSRRFPSKIEVPLPDKKDLTHIFEFYANKYTFQDQTRDYDYNDTIVTRNINPRVELMHEHKFSGDDVQKTLARAADFAGENNRLIIQADLDKAIDLTRTNKEANNDHNDPRNRPVPQGMYL